MDPSSTEVLEKLRKYCAFQERSHRDVGQKMWDMKIPSNLHDDILIELISSDFINEERFAKAYVRGKFRIKKWGRLKIVKGLKEHNISKPCIQIGLREIDDRQYMKNLRQCIDEKRLKLTEKNPWKRKSAIMRFAQQRGFETELILELIG